MTTLVTRCARCVILCATLALPALPALAADPGPALPAAEAVSPQGMLAYEVSLATLDHGLALAWHGGNLAHSALWLRFMGGDGRPSGEALQLTDAQREAYEPDLQTFGRRLVIAWYEKEPVSGAMSAWLACLGGNGQILWRRVLSGEGRNGRNPVVRVAGGELAVAWIETQAAAPPAVWTARYDASGHVTGVARQVGPASPTTWNLNAAVDGDGRLYLVYDATLQGRASEVQWARIDQQRIDNGTLTSDDDLASTYPDIAIDGKQVAVSWADARDGHGEIYLYTGALSTLPRDVTHAAQRVTHASGSAFGAYLAWNRHRLELAWDESGDGAAEIHAQQFAADGHALGEPRALTHAGVQSLIPAVRAWRRGFAIAWNEYRSDPADSAHGKPLASVARLQRLP